MKLIIDYVKPYFKQIFTGMSVKVLATIVELLIPSILAYIIDSVVPMQNFSLVLVWGGVMFACSLFALIGNIYSNRNASAVARDATRELRHDLFEKSMYLSNDQIDEITVPSLITRMTTDTYNIQRMIGAMQRIGVRAPLIAFGGLVVTFVLDPYLSMILLAIMPILGFTIFFISRKSMGLFTMLQEKMDNLVRVVRENLTGVRVIKALSKEDYEKERFDGVNTDVVDSETKAVMTMSITGPVMNISLNTGYVLVIVLGAYRVNAGLLEVGKIVAFLAYFTTILRGVMMINRMIRMLAHSVASANRIASVMEREEGLEVEDIPEVESEYHIEFKDICFSYDKIEYNLANINFGLKESESLGIIGATGSGKSTLISLLLRLYDADEGSILINGRDIRSMELSELRRKFGVVFQNDAVFDDTIEGNIRLGREIDIDKVEEAAIIAQANDYIESLGGYEYDVDARGANLSGGQKQRLLISRAIAGEPEILILDDSSSALDYRTDAKLRQELDDKMKETTQIIIAQRVSSIKDCSKIIVLDEGDMVGFGTHEELMESSEIYKEIENLQMGEVDYYAKAE